jgi:hypothetical protein
VSPRNGPRNEWSRRPAIRKERTPHKRLVFGLLSHLLLARQRKEATTQDHGSS